MGRLKKTQYCNISVYYSSHLRGGGDTFGQQFISVVEEKIGPVEHVFEFCAGCGFIGFSLLANGLCKRLTLADVNPEAVKCCQETVKRNNLQDKVAVYLSDCLNDIPKYEKWDLVVSNPPHFPSTEEKYREDIKMFDPNMIIHNKFYGEIHNFLKPGGSILFQENEDATDLKSFSRILEENNLKIVDSFKIGRFAWLFDSAIEFLKIFKNIFSPEYIIKYDNVISAAIKPNLFYFLLIEPKREKEADRRIG